MTQLRITQGTVTLRVRDLADEGVEIDTPNGAVTIDRLRVHGQTLVEKT